MGALNAEMATSAFVKANASKDFKRANEIDGQISQEHFESAKALFKADEGKKKMAEAAAMEEEANRAAADVAGQYLVQEKANQLRDEARKLQAQQAEEQASAVGAMFADSMGSQMFDKAKKAEQEAALDLMKSVGQTFTQSAGLLQLKAEVAGESAADRQKRLEAACASILQGVWRSKLARRDMTAKRLKRDELREKGAAIKVQGAWRRKKANQKIVQMKIQREKKMEEYAAMKLQGSFRISRARKVAKQKREEAMRLKEEGSAMLVQALYRRVQARKKVQKLKAEKQAVLEHGAALMVQSAWRIKKARALTGEIRTEVATKNNMSLVLTTKLRQHIAKRRTKALHKENHRPFEIRLVNATGLAAKDIGGKSDPYVIVTAVEAGENNQTQGKQKAMYTSQVIKSTLEPEWNETFVMAGCNGFATLVFTVLDKDFIQIGSHDLLGQATYSIAKEDLWSNAPPFQTTLDLGRKTLAVYEKDGTKEMNIEDAPGQGQLVIEFIPRETHASLCAWCSRFESHNTSKFFGNKSDWNRKFSILTLKDGLVVYDTAQNLNDIDKKLPSDRIGDCTIVDFEGRTSVLEIARVGEDKPLNLHFDRAGEALMWKMKLNIVRRQIHNQHVSGGAFTGAGAAAEELAVAPRRSVSKGGLFGRKSKG